MAEPLATADELSVYLQRPVSPELADMALTLASGKVRGYINRPGLLALVDATTAPDDVRAVVLAVAGRVVSNPSDIRQESVGATSITYATETLGVQLAPTEREDLRRYRIRARTLTVADEVAP